MQSVLITNNVVSSNLAHGEVYSIQHYVVKYLSNLRQVGGFLRVLRYPPPIKLTAINIVESSAKHHEPELEPHQRSLKKILCLFSFGWSATIIKLEIE